MKRKKTKLSRETYRKHQRDTAPHRLGAVELGRLAQPELLVAGRVLPAQHRGAVQQHDDALARGQLGRDARVAVRDGDLGLRREVGRGGESRGLVWSVNHVWQRMDLYVVYVYAYIVRGLSEDSRMRCVLREKK